MKSFMLSSAAIASVSMALASPVLAQDAEESAAVQDTIVVTVQKREQALRDVPITVSAVSEKFMEDLGLTEFEDVARFIPGLNVQEQSPNNPGFVIRGITSDSGDAVIEPRIAVFQDGVSISRSRGSIVELFDIERVEVAKGPQPTLFGRGALIGGINIIQNKPEFDFNGSATLGVGNFNEVTAEGFINAPIIDDKLAVRLAGTVAKRDGYVESLNPAEEDFNSRDMKAVRLSARLTPMPNLDMNLILNWQEDTPTGTAFKSGVVPPVPGASTDAWDPAYLNTFGNFLNGEPLGLDRTVQSATLLADWDISETLSLSSITGTRHFESLEVFDPDGFGIPLFVFAEDAQGDQFSQELRLNYDSGENFVGFVGVSYFDEDGAQHVPLTFDERATQMLLGGLPLPTSQAELDAAVAANPTLGLNLTVLAQSGGTVAIPLKPIHNEIYENQGRTESTEFFADGSYTLMDGLEVTAGVRYTSDEKDSRFFAWLPQGPSNLTGAGLLLVPTTGMEQSTDSFDGWTYRVAAKFELNEDWNLFANHARGRRPEVITPSGTSNSPRFTTLPAEEVDSFETGLKGSTLEGAMQLEGSLFFYDYTNFQTNIFQNGQLTPTNAGNAESYGFEGQMTWNASDNLDVFASYTYNHSRFDKQSDGVEQQFGGNPFRLSPDHAASLALFYQRDLEGFGHVEFTPSVTWQSKVYFDNSKRDLISQDAYALANVNLSWTPESEAFEVELYAKNLFDEEYLIDGGNTGDNFGIPTFIAGAPRFYGARISKDF